MRPLSADIAVYVLVAAIVLWWLLGPSVSATVDLGPNAKVGGAPVDTRYKGPLETAPTEVPNTPQEYEDVGVILANPWAYL